MVFPSESPRPGASNLSQAVGWDNSVLVQPGHGGFGGVLVAGGFPCACDRARWPGVMPALLPLLLGPLSSVAVQVAVRAGFSHVLLTTDLCYLSLAGKSQVSEL